MAFEETLAIRLRAAYMHLHSSANRHFRSFDATANQYAVLTCLADEAGITQQMLVERLTSDRRTISNTLAQLQGMGFVTRRAHPKDQRAWALYLTRKGSSKQKLLYESAEGLRNQLEEAVPPEHLKMVLDCLESMAKRLDPDEVEKVITKNSTRK